MTLTFSGILLALFGLSLILITLSLRLLRGPGSDNSLTSPARFFLIALRLAIGWHCFVEGMEKLNTPNWSSEAYLRESMGPLAESFRGIAGDRIVAKATLGPDNAFPAELEREWKDYFNAFTAYYDLSNEQVERAKGIFDQRKKDTVTVLLSKTELVTKASPYPPELKIDMTMKQRLEEHERLVGLVRAAEAKFPTTDKDVLAEWKNAKADLAKWRSGLKKSIDAETAKFKRFDDAETSKLKKLIDTEVLKMKDTSDSKEAAKLKKGIDELMTRLSPALEDVLTSEQRQKGPMPEPKAMPVTSWRLLEVSDFFVKWGLIVLGVCLMLGIFSRCSSFLTAILLLSFYLAMPPLPGWPESPRLEGHYALINKTLIEVLALLALACIPTGRWAGLDGLLQFLWPERAQAVAKTNTGRAIPEAATSN